MLHSRQLLIWGAAVVIIGSLLLVVVALGGEGTAAEDTTWEHIQTQQVLVVGIDIAFPPFGLVEDNQIQGIDADLARALVEELGMAVRFVPVNFDGMWDTLRTGQVDILIAAVRPDPNQVAVVRYTSPYFDAGYVLVGRGQLPLSLTAIPDDTTLAVIPGSHGDLTVREILETEQATFQIERLAAVNDVTAAVASGEVELALLDAVSAFDAQRRHPLLQVATERFSHDPHVIAVRRSDWKLHHEIEAILYRWRRDGTLDEILARWLSPD
jgi:ABC-type amino acid transport substrate-binding protein